ncbi:hypothetical protein RB195_022688 [Necator americanus]|uniref:Uncharacterized protein n=1 Tax=Necator americanus TaxID=51031 RepID=A0ABR1EGG4_NECAM
MFEQTVLSRSRNNTPSGAYISHSLTGAPVTKFIPSKQTDFGDGETEETYNTNSELSPNSFLLSLKEVFEYAGHLFWFAHRSNVPPFAHTDSICGFASLVRGLLSNGSLEESRVQEKEIGLKRKVHLGNDHPSFY